MKKIVFILLLMFSFISAKSTDVYFANGILTKPEEANKNAKILRKAINRPDVPEVYVAYNHTFDIHFVKGGHDLIESLYQKLSLTKKVDKVFNWLRNNELVTAHQFDLDRQLSSYRASISSGKRVLTVTHSQGNLFTYEAYEDLKNEGLGDEFDAISVASPMFSSIKDDTKTFSWDNDLVADLALNPLRKRYYCEVRKVEWIKYRVYPTHPMPTVNYIYDSDKEKVLQGDWIPKEPFLKRFDSNVHSFTFYMGEALRYESGKIIYEPYMNRELKTNYLKDKILAEVNRIIDNNAQIGNTNNSGGTSDDNGKGSDTGYSTNDGGNDTGSTGGGGADTEDNSGTFDYKTQCSNIDFPDPIPDELENSINEAISQVSGAIDTETLCQTINGLVQAYNLANGGGVPSF